MDYTIEDLEAWNSRILEIVHQFGLDPYPQEFEICDHEDMLTYMVYSGMPSHYPHWSYGKSFEKLKTLYEYGVSGLPYEMVINSNPSIAYLMRDNSLALQVLTIAHVYGHNDFFKNNFTFGATRAKAMQIGCATTWRIRVSDWNASNEFLMRHTHCPSSVAVTCLSASCPPGSK
jgi:stage V sporulation protein R